MALRSDHRRVTASLDETRLLMDFAVLAGETLNHHTSSLALLTERSHHGMQGVERKAR